MSDAIGHSRPTGILRSIFDENTILKADANNTPIALTVDENTLVGRATAGTIAALTATEVRTILNVEDGADVTDATNVADAGAAMAGGAFHDGFSDFVANEHIDWTIDQGATNIHAGNYTDTTYVSSDFVHDDLTGFVANEHIDHTTVSIVAGTGLTGGGTIAANRTLNVDVGIANDKIVQMDDLDAAASDYAKFTANGLEGRSYAEVRSDLNVEDGADVTDTANVTAAGALMDSEVDADLKTFSLPANTTISVYGATLVDDADAATARATLGLAIGTDVLAQQAIGIADDNLLEVDDLDAADNDYAKFTLNGLEGRSYAEVRSDLNVADGADVTGSNSPQAHKDSHDPEDGSDALDTAAPSELASVQAAATGSSHSLARADHQHQIQHSIADNHLVTIDDADVATSDYAKFTANGLQGRSYAEVRTDLSLNNVPNEDATDPQNWDPAKTVGNFLVGNETTFVAESGNTARTSLGLGTGDSPTFAELTIQSSDPSFYVRNSDAADITNFCQQDFKLNSSTTERVFYRVRVESQVVTDGTRDSRVEHVVNHDGSFGNVMVFEGANVLIPTGGLMIGADADPETHLHVKDGTAVSDPALVRIESAAQSNSNLADVYAGLEFAVNGASGSAGAFTDGIVAAIKAIDYRTGASSYEDCGLGFYTHDYDTAGVTLRGGFSNNGGFHILAEGDTLHDVQHGNLIVDVAIGIGVTSASEALDVSGNIAVTGTVDGRDIATDGTKLDGIEASADVTDATNVAAAGAVMDSDYSAKGKILVGTGAGTWTALTVGTNDQVFTADSAEASGVKWADAGGGSEAFFANIALCQGIAVTAASSGSNGIAVADNDAIDFATYDFSGVIAVRLASYTPASEQILEQKHDGSNGRKFSLQTSGVLRLTINGTDYDSTVATGLTDDTAHLLGYSVTRETAGAAGEVIFTVDGVQLGAAVAITAGAPTTVNNAVSQYVMGTSTTRTAGVVYFFGLYSYALTVAGHLSLYRNGIAEADKWPDNTIFYTSDFSAGTDGWGAVGGALVGNIDTGADGAEQPPSDDWLRETISGTTTHILYKVGMLVGSKRNRIDIDYFCPSANSHVDGFAYSAGAIDHIETVVADSATTYSENIIAQPSGSLFLYLADGESTSFEDPGNDDVFYIKNVAVKQIGAVLALEPEGIQPAPGQWLDSSSNKLHAMQPAAGTSPVRLKKDFEFRWTNTWTASAAAQYIGGVNQNVLSDAHFITEIVSKVTESTGVENIEIGDGSDADRFVAAVGPSGTTLHTIANNTNDGTNKKLVVTPAAAATMTIEFVVRGFLLES